MLIACKCLNITGYNHSVCEQALKRNGLGLSFDEIAPGSEEQLHGHDGLAAFYYLYREFAKTAIGPISDLTETVNQIDLAYEVPIKHLHIKYCINCNTIAHVKNISSSEYWINSKLLTSPERINAFKDNKLYSKVFGILMTTDSTSNNKMDSTISTSPVSNNMSTSTPTTPTTTTAPNMDLRNIQHSSRQQAYIKKLTQQLEEQLQRDYNETNERISRFIEQQAAILESNREKAKQEYQILVSKINRVPDELKVIYNHSNTSSININNNNNEDFNNASAANTKSTTNNALENQIQTNSDRNNHQNQHTNNVAGNNKIPSSTTTSTNTSATAKSSESYFTTLKQEDQQTQLTTPGLDTPPATPDSTPMSVGNSPTFRQQTSIFGNTTTAISGKNSMISNVMAGGGIIDGGVNGIDDCLFDLDGMENYPVSVSDANQMSDVEETEDAEDALGELEGVHIPRNTSRPSGIMAKSLPISITNVIRSNRFNDIDDLETDELEETRNVDIAASIQALARSVHGDTVFGDLPRPRLSTLI